MCDHSNTKVRERRGLKGLSQYLEVVYYHLKLNYDELKMKT